MKYEEAYDLREKRIDDLVNDPIAIQYLTEIFRIVLASDDPRSTLNHTIEKISPDEAGKEVHFMLEAARKVMNSKKYLRGILIPDYYRKKSAPPLPEPAEAVEQLVGQCRSLWHRLEWKYWNILNPLMHDADDHVLDDEHLAAERMRKRKMMERSREKERIDEWRTIPFHKKWDFGEGELAEELRSKVQKLEMNDQDPFSIIETLLDEQVSDNKEPAGKMYMRICTIDHLFRQVDFSLDYDNFEKYPDEYSEDESTEYHMRLVKLRKKIENATPSINVLEIPGRKEEWEAEHKESVRRTKERESIFTKFSACVANDNPKGVKELFAELGIPEEKWRDYNWLRCHAKEAPPVGMNKDTWIIFKVLQDTEKIRKFSDFLAWLDGSLPTGPRRKNRRALPWPQGLKTKAAELLKHAEPKQLLELLPVEGERWALPERWAEYLSLPVLHVRRELEAVLVRKTGGDRMGRIHREAYYGEFDIAQRIEEYIIARQLELRGITAHDFLSGNCESKDLTEILDDLRIPKQSGEHPDLIFDKKEN